MKKIVYLVSLLIILSQLAHSQEFVRQNPYPLLAELQDIYVDEEGFGWAVGSDGAILHTEDHGQNWEIQESPNDEWNFTEIEYLPGSNGLIAYIGGDKLLKTVDGGETWLEEDPGFNTSGAPYLRVFNENDILLIASQSVIRSFDGGTTWSRNLGPSAGMQKISFVDINNGWVLAPAGDMNYTSDGGANWEFKVNREIFNSTLGTFHFHSVDKGWMTTNNGTIYHTMDQGTTWDSISNVRFTNNWRQIISRDGINLYSITGNLMHTSDDGGFTWKRIQSAVDAPATQHGGLHLRDNDLWMVGNFTTILYSDDDTETWTDQIAGAKGFIRDASAYSDTHLATAGDGGMLYTTNGGAEWELFPMPNDRAGYSVYMIDENTILVGGVGWIYRTEDGGESWSQTFSEGNTIVDIKQTSTGRIMAGGVRRNTVYVSDDEGRTWTTVYSNPDISGQIRDMAVVNETIYIVAYEGVLLKSSNNGASWSELTVPGDNPDVNLLSVYFFNENHGIITGAGSYFYRTRDGGTTWSKVPPSEVFNGGFFYFDDELTGYAAGGAFSGAGKIFKTLNGGDSWEIEHEAPTFFTRVLRPRTGDLSKLWVFGGGGNIELFAPCTDDPTIENLMVDEAYCSGDTARLSVDFSNAVEFFWNIPDGWFIEGNSNSSTITCIVGESGGNISVRVSNTCVESETLMKNTEVSDQIESVDFIVDGNELSTSIIGDRYQWYLNNSAINGATSSSYTVEEEGNYRVGVTADPCGEVLSESRFVTVTSTENIFNTTVHIWPNPTSDLLHVELSASVEGRIAISDLKGNKLMNENLKQKLSVDLSSWVPGMYVLTIVTDGGSEVNKIWVNE